MSAILDQLHNAVAALEAEGHALADKFRAIYDHLRGEATTDAATLEHDAVQAGETVAKDAETAMGPVLAEAEKDASKLGTEAAHDVAKAVTDPAPPAAS